MNADLWQSIACLLENRPADNVKVTNVMPLDKTSCLDS